MSRKLIEKITALEAELCVDSDMNYAEMLIECDESDSRQQRSKIVEKLNERFRKLEDMESQCSTLALGKGAWVIVKNTLDDGLILRNGPAGNQIGGMFDGETGKIISDGETTRGLVWYEIEWDKPVKNPKSGCGDRNVCIGWSVAVLDNGTEVLELIK